MEMNMPTQEEHDPPTSPVQQDEVVYKYKYKVFDSFAGERYLYSLAQKFAPIACWRTWWAAVSYQVPGETCYVGVTRLTDERDGRVGVKERKVQLDLMALEVRGWLRQEQVLKTFRTRDGHLVTRAVPEKDFTGFYDTAYAYHQWLESTEYIAPERENLPLILADPALIKRLIRFENYRRLLVNAKPGPKVRVFKQDFYTCQLALLEQKSEENGQDVQDEPKPNQYLNTSVNDDSPYRILGSSQSTNRYEDSEDSTAEEEEQVAAKTIRNFHPKSSPTHFPSNPNPNSVPQEAQGGEAAKEVEGVKSSINTESKQESNTHGTPLVGVSDQYAPLNGGTDQVEQEEEVYYRIEEQTEPMLPTRPERTIPPFVVKEGTFYARQYDDAHLIQSDITRFKKIYATAEQALPDFHEGMYWEHYDAAKDVAAKRARKRTNSKGFVTRVPYLFTCLENAFAFSLEELVYLRGDDVLCADTSLFEVIDTMRDTYNRLYNTDQIDVEYRTWLGEILDEYEKRKEPKERLNATTRPYPVNPKIKLVRGV